jgi:predicted RNA-binding Zn-ribbon protein involved in translation (DUF1610 family)
MTISMSTFIISIVLLSPIIIPILLILCSIDDLQKRKAADRFPCTNCGHILGSPAIDLADIKQQELIDRLQREHPNMKLRLSARTVHAICTRCGTQFTYLDKTRTFKAVPKTLTDALS